MDDHEARLKRIVMRSWRRGTREMDLILGPFAEAELVAMDAESLDAYERLLLEVMRGNQNLFVRKDEIEYAWKWCDQLIDGWQRVGAPPKPYAAGSWGPAASIALISRDGRSWYDDL